jgi:hypothetical protein
MTEYTNDGGASSPADGTSRAVGGHCLACVHYTGEECREPASIDYEHNDAGHDIPEIAYMTDDERAAHLSAGHDVVHWRNDPEAEYGDEDHPLAVTAHVDVCPGFEPHDGGEE